MTIQIDLLKTNVEKQEKALKVNDTSNVLYHMKYLHISAMYVLYMCIDNEDGLR